MDDYQEIDDQAGMMMDMVSLHLNREDHKGKILDGCPFCEGFLKYPTEEPLMSFRYVILDLSDPNDKL